MNIEFVEKDDIFKAIEVGAVFKWGNDFYMKIEPIKCESIVVTLNAIHLDSGIATHLDDFTQIIPVSAKVVVERGNE